MCMTPLFLHSVHLIHPHLPPLLRPKGERLFVPRLSPRRLSFFPQSRWASQDSRGSFMLNLLQPWSSPTLSMNTTPQATPPSARPTSSQLPELLVCGRDDIPQVVLFPPEEEASQFSEPAHYEAKREVAGPAQNLLLLASPPEGKFYLIFSMGFLSHCHSVYLSLTICLSVTHTHIIIFVYVSTNSVCTQT